MKIYRNGNSTKFFLYAGNGKYFKELFTFTLNEIIVVVGMCLLCQAFTMLAVDWLRCMQRNKALRNEENQKQ